MQFAIGAMSVGDILDRGLKILLSRLPTFYVIGLVIMLPLLLWELVSPHLWDSPQMILVSMAVMFIGTLTLSQIGTAAMLHVVAQEFIGRRAGVGDAFQFAMRYFGTLLAASLMFALVIGVGYVLCLLPGLIFLTWYALYSQVIVVEGKGATKSFERSKQLTEGYRLRLFGLYLLIAVVQTILGFGLVFVLNAVLPATEQVQVQGSLFPQTVIKSYPNLILQIFIKYLLNILLTTYFSVCLTLFYFDLRIRKEGYDLELAAKQQVGIA